jgi:hypothetical protein
VAIEGERILVEPPEEFTEILKRLMPEEENEDEDLG